jgi:Flp pilus assembly protein TadB
MTDYDRYDFAISMLVGLIMVGALLLGAPLWTLPLFLAIAVTISLYRHLPLPPRRSPRRR